MSDILTVLDSLNPSNGEELAQYRERTPLVIARTPLVPPQKTRPSAHTYMEDALSSSATHQTSPELKHIIACEKILRLMKKRLARIKEYAKQSDQDAVSKASPTKEDFRIVDVRIHDNSDADERTETVRFRRLLAIRSFSHDFRDFQRQKLTAARADIQTNYLLSSADQFQVGSVNDFICSRGDIFDRERAKKMVHEGTKLAVLEELYGHCGISAVLWLAPSWVRLSYRDLTIFLELLLQDPRYGSVETASQELADWFERCQIRYDDPVNNSSLSKDDFSRQPISREMTKRRRPMSLKTAKPRKARRFTIQHNNSRANSDGATRDKHRQEESRPKDHLFPQTCPPFSQALHHSPSGGMDQIEERSLQVHGFPPTHHLINDTTTGSRLQLLLDGQSPLDYQRSKGCCSENISNTAIASDRPQQAHVYSSRHGSVHDSVLDSILRNSQMADVFWEDHGPHDQSMLSAEAPAETSYNFTDTPEIPQPSRVLPSTDAIHPTDVPDFMDAVHPTDVADFMGAVHPTDVADFMGAVHPTDVADLWVLSTQQTSLILWVLSTQQTSLISWMLSTPQTSLITWMLSTPQTSLILWVLSTPHMSQILWAPYTPITPLIFPVWG